MSAHLSCDADEPLSIKVRDIISYCSSSSRRQVINGCDAKAYIMWGNMGTEPSQESLTAYLVRTNQNILIQGNKQMPAIHNRQEFMAWH
jgi:hypothetical protein